MEENNENPHGEADPLRTDEPTSLQSLKFHQLLFGLFFYPDAALAMMVRRGRPYRAIATLSLLCLVGGLILGLIRVPDVFSATEDWGRWLAEKVEEVWVEDGELRWRKPAVLPHTTAFKGWRVDFVRSSAVFAPVKSGIAEGRGIWITPKQVFLWYRTPDGSHKSLPLLRQREDSNDFSLEKVLSDGASFFAPSWEDGDSLSGEDIVREAHQVAWQAVPVVILYNCAAVVIEVLAYTFVLAALALVFRGPIAAAGFPGVVVFHAYAAIPPLLVACIYAGLRLPFLDLSTAFVAAFVVYLAFTFARIRRARMAEMDRDHHA